MNALEALTISLNNRYHWIFYEISQSAQKGNYELNLDYITKDGLGETFELYLKDLDYKIVKFPKQEKVCLSWQHAYKTEDL